MKVKYNHVHQYRYEKVLLGCAKLYRFSSFALYDLNLSKTTNFRLFQTERVGG